VLEKNVARTTKTRERERAVDQSDEGRIEENNRMSSILYIYKGELQSIPDRPALSHGCSLLSYEL
jgi:hypothetical protein